MGQKVSPIGFRIGLIQDWRSRWFAKGKRYPEYLAEDIEIRRYLLKSLIRAGISRIEIERADKVLNIDIFTARPGIIIGKGGTEVDKLKSDIEKMVKRNVQISVQEVKKPELDANLVAQAVAEQLIGRVPFRRAMKRAVSAATKGGAKGIRISCAGRLGGAEMARREWYREGRVPLHTLRADIDYGYVNARTTFGSIGVKVWIYKGEIIGRRLNTGIAEEKRTETLGLVTPRKKKVVPEDMAVKGGPAKEEILAKEEKREEEAVEKAAEAEPVEKVEAEAKLEEAEYEEKAKTEAEKIAEKEEKEIKKEELEKQEKEAKKRTVDSRQSTVEKERSEDKVGTGFTPVQGREKEEKAKEKAEKTKAEKPKATPKTQAKKAKETKTKKPAAKKEKVKEFKKKASKENKGKS